MGCCGRRARAATPPSPAPAAPSWVVTLPDGSTIAKATELSAKMYVATHPGCSYSQLGQLPDDGTPVGQVAVIVPMLGRPGHIEPLLESLHSATVGARVLFVTSPNDHEVNAELGRLGQDRVYVAYAPIGDYARKINVGYRRTREPLVFTGASDLRFHPGWLEAARKHIDDNPKIGVVGTNDLCNQSVQAGLHATHFLVTRAYAQHHGTIDERNSIYPEVYPHEFVDSELKGTAEYRDAYAMALDSHVEHLHPTCGKGQPDATYNAQHHRMAIGRRIYDRRKSRWGQ